MVVQGVPGTLKFLSPIIISSCLHILAAWELDGGAGNPGNQILSPILDILNGIMVPEVPQTCKLLFPIIISSCLLSCSLGTGWWCRGVLGTHNGLVSHHNSPTVYCRGSRFVLKNS